MTVYRIAFSCIFATLLSTAADAELIAWQDASVVGNGAEPMDGFNVTTDTRTNLEWLDINLSLGLTKTEMIQELESGTLYEGWRYAKCSEAFSLYDSSGFDISDKSCPRDRPSEVFRDHASVRRLFNINGYTSGLDSRISFVFAEDFFVRADEDGLMVLTTEADEIFDTDPIYIAAASHLLVRSVPEPNSGKLLVAAIFLALGSKVGCRWGDWQR